GPNSGTGIGINFERNGAANIAYLTLARLWVRRFGGDGIKLDTPIVSTFNRVVSAENGGNGFNLWHAGTSNTFISCYGNANGQAGYRLFGVVYSDLSGCASDSNGIGYLIDECQGISFNACGMEATEVVDGTWDGTGMKINNSHSISMYNCWNYDNKF